MDNKVDYIAIALHPVAPSVLESDGNVTLLVFLYVSQAVGAVTSPTLPPSFALGQHRNVS